LSLYFNLKLIIDKIWIQRDFTESGIAQELMEMGIPKEKIVLGYRSPTVVREDGFNRTFPMTDRQLPIPGLN
jgi:hypothetical protein